MTEPRTEVDLRSRLRSTITERLRKAQAAADSGPPWHIGDWGTHPYVLHLLANKPAGLISLYEGLLRIVDEHGKYNGYCAICRGTHFPCSLLRILADSLGIDTGSEP